MKERIEQIMKYYGLTATQFAVEIGIQRSALSHIMSGRNKPSLDFVLKTKQRFSEINTDWLLLGFGKMVGGKQSITEEKYNQTGSTGKNETIVKSENPVPYGKNTDKTSGLIEKSSSEVTDANADIDKIVFFLKDGTFKIYQPE